MKKKYLRRTKNLKLVAVRWLDAATTDGWESNDHADRSPQSVYTVGFLVLENKDVLVVASTSDLHSMNNARISIPQGMIRSLKRFSTNIKLEDYEDRR